MSLFSSFSVTICLPHTTTIPFSPCAPSTCLPTYPPKAPPEAIHQCFVNPTHIPLHYKIAVLFNWSPLCGPHVHNTLTTSSPKVSIIAIILSLFLRTSTQTRHISRWQPAGNSMIKSNCLA